MSSMIQKSVKRFSATDHAQVKELKRDCALAGERRQPT
jgi:hypothetical protein